MTQQQAALSNREIWNNIYQRQGMLMYPSEMLVRRYYRYGRDHLSAARPHVLDYGAGSGNNTEFFIRQGCQVTAADISEPALRLMRANFTQRHFHLPQ